MGVNISVELIHSIRSSLLVELENFDAYLCNKSKDFATLQSVINNTGLELTESILKEQKLLLYKLTENHLAEYWPSTGHVALNKDILYLLPSIIELIPETFYMYSTAVKLNNKNYTCEDLADFIMLSVGHEMVHREQYKTPLANGVPSNRIAGWDNKKEKYIKKHGRDIWDKGTDIIPSRYLSQHGEIGAYAWHIVYSHMNKAEDQNNLKNIKKELLQKLKRPQSLSLAFYRSYFSKLTPQAQKRFIKIAYYYINNWNIKS